MRISLSESGKRFNRDWIFRKFSYEFEPGRSYAIVGPNGSGKSTLLQVAGGAIAASTGEIRYTIDSRAIEPDEVYQYISIAAPYLELIEEMTVLEFLDFHQKFKPLLRSISISQIIDLVGLEKATNKQIRYYSSGMKQRVKLAQAIFSDTPCLLLDEPCTNLDAEGIALYKSLIKNYCGDRLVLVSSNDEQEYFFCEERISILDYK
jgi:ABC-type multidrug transport system ATPase subunit